MALGSYKPSCFLGQGEQPHTAQAMEFKAPRGGVVWRYTAYNVRYVDGGVALTAVYGPHSGVFEVRLKSCYGSLSVPKR